MLFLVLPLLLILLTVTFRFLGIYAARAFAFARVKSEEEALRLCTEMYLDFDREWFDSLGFEPFTVSSPRGYDLRGVCLRGTGDRTIVLCHGHTFTWHGQVKYMPLLIKQGWNIVAYNHRYHGSSGGDCCTAGYFEKEDLKLICDWAFARFPATRKFGVQGESMGAATVLQYLPMDKRLDFVWADCPYSDLTELYRYQLGFVMKIPRPFHGPILFFADAYFKKRCHFSMADVSPRREIMKKPIPLFLAHGSIDAYVPTYMSKQMYEARQEYAPTYLVLIGGARHAEAYKTDTPEYDKHLKAFLEAYGE